MAGPSFITWFLDDGGGLIGMVLIAAGLFVVQAVFTFLLWRKGDEKYLFKFISYAIAATTLIIGAITWIQTMIMEDISMEALIGLAAIFLIAVCIAGGIQIFFFIRDTWMKKETKA